MLTMQPNETTLTVPLAFFRGEHPRPAPIGGLVKTAGERAGSAELLAGGDAVRFTRGEGSGRAVVRYENTALPVLVAELSIEVMPLEDTSAPDRVVFDEANAIAA